MSWLFLFLAGLLEVVWAVGLKYTLGFTRFFPSCITLLAMIASIWLLNKALETLPLGTAYAVWVGIGATGAALVGIFFLQESVSVARLAFIGLLIFSIMGLKLTSGH